VATALLAAVVLVALIVFYFFHSRAKSVSPPASSPTESAAPASPPPAPAAATPPSNASSTEAAKPASNATASPGGVRRRVVPDVPKSARNTISGTIKVVVKVEADASGKVTAARFASAGPSKYFSSLALKAARGWEFDPPVVNGQPAASAWLLKFRFQRSSTQVDPERVIP
jgi:TonB family protein